MADELIKLRAVHGLTQGPLRLNPCKDLISGKLKGVSEEQTGKRIVDENTYRTIQEGLVLNVSKSEIDRVDWEWIRQNKEIVMSLEEGLSNPQALYYVDQPDKELEKRLKKSKTSYEAEKIVHEASEIKRVEICRILGQDVKLFRPIEVLDYLLSVAKGKPQDVIDAAKDPDAKEKLFVYKCMDMGKIRKDVHGHFRYGDMVLGASIDNVVDWMTNEKNRDLVARLYESLYGTATPAKSIITEFDADFLKSKSENNGLGQDGESGEKV